MCNTGIGNYSQNTNIVLYRNLIHSCYNGILEEFPLKLRSPLASGLPPTVFLAVLDLSTVSVDPGKQKVTRLYQNLGEPLQVNTVEVGRKSGESQHLLNTFEVSHSASCNYFYGLY